MASPFSLCLSGGIALTFLNRIVTVELPLRAIGLQFVGGVVMAIVVWPMDRLFPDGNAVITITLAGIGAATYFVVMVGISGEVREKIITIIKSTRIGG